MNTIPARWFTAVGPSRSKDLIVVHSMEAPDKPDRAEEVGRFFQGLPSANKASAHVGADDNSRCRYVSDDDVAYGAPNANHNGLHLELTGYARYNTGDWAQPNMMLMLQQGAAQVREWHDKYGIPLRYIDAAALRAGIHGVTTHHQVTLAYGPSGGHWDPGYNFPIATLLAMASGSPSSPHREDSTMPAFLHCECPNGGFWLVKPNDGGVFAYGSAPFFGALPGKVNLAAPIVDMAPHLDASGRVDGYWLLGADGGVFAFGAAPFTDSYAAHPEWQGGVRDFVAISQLGTGYVVVAVERGSDPPNIQSYDLSVKR